MIFSIMPRPDPQVERERKTRGSGIGGRGIWDHDVKESTLGDEGELSEEQLEYLAHAPTNEDGVPLDINGEPVWKDGGDDELGHLMKSLGSRKQGNVEETT